MKNYYVISYLPDGKDCPYFVEKDWVPQLPYFDIYRNPPDRELFSDKYVLQAKTTRLNGDFLIEDDIASERAIQLISDFNTPYFSIPIEVNLQRGKVPKKKYELFYLTQYISILDIDGSIFATAASPGSPPESDNSGRMYFDRIDKFHVRKDIESDLFFCIDISKAVCSGEFKSEYEARSLTGLKFTPIDESFVYDPWSGF